MRVCAQGGTKSTYRIRASQDCGEWRTLRNRGRAWGIVLAAVVLAPAAWFSVAPTEGASAGFQFSAAGDFGAWTGFRTTLGLLNESGSDFALAIGDLSYGGFTGYADNTTEAGWCAKFHRYYENVIILAGNHDTGAFPPGEGNINNFTKYCPFPTGLQTVVFGEYGKQYYFDYPRTNPLARFIFLSPDLVFVDDGGEHYTYTVNSTRYLWTQSAIEQAHSLGIPWVIVAFHKSCIAAGEHACETGTDILNLLLSEKVDLILNAHTHNYERSNQLAPTESCSGIQLHSYDPGCIVHNGADGKYQRGAGPVLVIQGTGGRELDAFNQDDPYSGYFAAHMAKDTPGNGLGVVTYNVYPDRIVERTNFNGTYSDTFTIGDFSTGFVEQFVVALPIAAPVAVGLIGLGVGVFLTWRMRAIGMRAIGMRTVGLGARLFRL